MGGISEYDGRVEICVGGEWGTICHHFWGIEEASVACSQLGYPREGQSQDLCPADSYSGS